MIPNDLSWQLERIITREYAKIESDLILRVFKDFVKDSRKVTPENWRVRKIAQLAEYSRTWEKTLLKLTKEHAPAIKAEIVAAMKESAWLDEYVIGKVKGAAAVTSGIDTPAFKTRLDLCLKTANEATNITNTKAIHTMQKQFLNAVNSAYIRTSTGVSTLDGGIRKAVMDLGGEGVTVDYQSGDRVIRYQLNASVRRDLVTTINQQASDYSMTRAKEYGTNLVQVSSHSGARPEHARWQGGIYSIDGGTKQYPNLVEATGYGSVSGLCGANCRHTFFPYFAGYSKDIDPDDIPGLRENDRLYALQQKQRKYERTIRRYKRQIMGVEQCPDPGSDAKMLRGKLRSYSKDYRTFLEQNNLTRFNERERVYNYH